MAGTGEPIFKLRLLVDKKKNKVVLAEAGKDFVDVLFSLLTLPMGTIVRLLEKYQQNQKSQAVTIGCFNNVYRSVLDLGTAYFMAPPSQEMLLYPRSEKENQRRELKLNIDDTSVGKYYRCSSHWCKQAYSNFFSSRCCCGALMTTELYSQSQLHVGSDEIFVSDETLFTITDNIRVQFTSTGLTLKMLKEFGYTEVDQLHEMLVDVNHEKVLELLQCLFSSQTILTDVFLMKESSSDVRKACNMSTLSLPFKEENGDETDLISVTLFTRKLDKKVLYAECRKDFVDLLFTFLVLPLNSAWKLSGGNAVLGCVSNLCESYSSLSSSKEGNTLTDTCMLPWFYSCQLPLLDVGYAIRDTERQGIIGSQWYELKAMDPRYNSKLKVMDPGCNIYLLTLCNGFVKEREKFIVSDDLIITPMNFSVTLSTLKKWNLDLDDIEEQIISISKAEATRLLRASFMTSAALDTALGSLLPKKPKEEKL